MSLLTLDMMLTRRLTRAGRGQRVRTCTWVNSSSHDQRYEALEAVLKRSSAHLYPRTAVDHWKQRVRCTTEVRERLRGSAFAAVTTQARVGSPSGNQSCLQRSLASNTRKRPWEDLSLGTGPLCLKHIHLRLFGPSTRFRAWKVKLLS